MANNLGTNPIYIDDVGADITISSDQIVVSCITVTENGAAARKVTFIDNDDNVVLVIQVAASSTVFWGPIKPFRFSNGLIYDESASTIVDNDIVLIFKE